jgi:hypothetical protein
VEGEKTLTCILYLSASVAEIIVKGHLLHIPSKVLTWRILGQLEFESEIVKFFGDVLLHPSFDEASQWYFILFVL